MERVSVATFQRFVLPGFIAWCENLYDLAKNKDAGSMANALLFLGFVVLVTVSLGLWRIRNDSWSLILHCFNIVLVAFLFFSFGELKRKYERVMWKHQFGTTLVFIDAYLNSSNDIAPLKAAIGTALQNDTKVEYEALGTLNEELHDRLSQ